MDWTPSSSHRTTFSPLKPAAYTPFSQARGTLPPAPGTSFYASSPSAKPVNFFSQHNTTEEEEERGDFTLGRQRYFTPQETTGLEALLGQALRLDDEPTLVRAVKSVKRSMERNVHLQQSIIALATSCVAGCIAVVWWKSVGLPLAFLAWGVARVAVSRGRVGIVIAGVMAVVFAVWIGLPFTGVEVAYHYLLLIAYHPTIQVLAHRIGGTILLVILGRDGTRVVQIKMKQWRKVKEEEEARQQKMRGIFYTPQKGKGRSVSEKTVGKRAGVHSKSRSLFAAS